MVRKAVVIGSVVAAVVVAAGLATLIWWLVAHRNNTPNRYETIDLDGEGIGAVPHKAAFTRIPDSGDMFWWFYPTREGAARPLVLWLDGVTGLPPSLLANFAMIGPFDFNLQPRQDSWIDEYNLLFVDAPLGTGFSTAVDNAILPTTPEENAQHLLLMLESFYSKNSEYTNTPLYIFGEGYGAQLALSLANALHGAAHVSPNLKGVVLGNPIISPALALTQLGFYLDELGYVDSTGRAAIETFATTNNNLVNQGQYETAFNNFLSLGEFVNENAGAVAVNMNHITEKLSETNVRDTFGQKKYLKDLVGFNGDFKRFMIDTVAPALGITEPSYDSHQEYIQQAFKDSYMVPATDKVESLLNNTDVTVTIYNGNLDAVSNTPGQLEWVHNLHWAGQTEFSSNTRQTLVVNGFVEGYFQETEKLKFYWMNAAGLSVPLDSPAAMRRVLQRITS